jgi:hypothetical protein
MVVVLREGCAWLAASAAAEKEQLGAELQLQLAEGLGRLGGAALRRCGSGAATARLPHRWAPLNVLDASLSQRRALHIGLPGTWEAVRILLPRSIAPLAPPTHAHTRGAPHNTARSRTTRLPLSNRPGRQGP